MPDLFDQAAAEYTRASVARRTPIGDAFDRVVEEMRLEKGEPAPTLEVYPDTFIQQAAAEIDFYEGRGQKLTAGAKQAIVEQYRIAAGLEPTIGVDHRRRAKQRINERNILHGFAGGVGTALGRAGASLVSAYPVPFDPGAGPEIGRRIARAAEDYYGPAEGAAGAVGGFVGEAASLIAAAPAGPAGLAAIFGARGAGGVRLDVAERRAAGQEISETQEWSAALATGGVEAASGLVGGMLLQSVGKALAGLAPQVRAAFQAGGAGAARSVLMNRLPAFLGAEAAEIGEEALTQIADNAILKITEVAPEIEMYAGVKSAAIQAGLLSPVVGPIMSRMGAIRSQRREAGLAEEARAVGKTPEVRYRAQAKQIESKLPPVEPGMTRLWRGNRPGEIGTSPDFTLDLSGIALPAAEQAGGRISYVDVPTEDLASYEDAPGEYGVTTGIAAQAQAAPSPAGMRPPGTPVPQAVTNATGYHAIAGIPQPPKPDYEDIDEPRAAQIAQAYDSLTHDPADPEVAKAYAAFVKETKEQFEYLKRQGVTFEYWEQEGQPYANSDEMRADVANNHLYIYKGGELPEGHPLLDVDPDSGWTYNEIFRGVHDYFGHSVEGNGFGPRGEEHAWKVHSQMYSPLARGAMTTETRGQNSWINYGPLGPQNQANPGQTTYPPQKARLMPSWTWQVGAQPPPSAFPSTLTNPPLPPSVALDIRTRSQKLILDVEREYRTQVTLATMRTKEWEKKFSEDDLIDVGASVENIGRVDRPNETYNSVAARMTTAKWKMKQEYEKVQEEARNAVNAYLDPTNQTEYITALQDYLPHFYVKGRQDFNKAIRWLMKNSPNAQKRKLPTLKEAIDAGLLPVTQNVAVLHRMWANVNWRVATTRRFMAGLADITLPDGTPIILPRGKAPSDWITNNHPVLMRVYGRKDPKTGKTTLWRGGAAIHPEAAPFVQAMTDGPHSNKWINAWEALNAWAKKASLSLSFFHHIALTESALGVFSTVVNPLRGIIMVAELDPTTGKRKLFQQPHRIGVKLMRNRDVVQRWMRKGMTLEATSDVWLTRINKDLMNLEAKVRGVPIVGPAVKLARKFNQWWDRALWEHYHSGLKLFAAEDILTKELARNPGVDVEATMETIASHLNDAFGGLEWEATVFRNPRVRQAMHWALLAPDWTYSNLRIAGRVLITNPKSTLGRLQLKYWRNTVATLVAAPAAVQAAIFLAFGDEEEGDKMFPWQNEAGKKWDIDVTPLMRKLQASGVNRMTASVPTPEKGREKQRYYTHFGKQVREVYNWLENPTGILGRKASPMVQTVWEQITGSQVDGFKLPWAGEDFWSWQSLQGRTEAIGGKFVPFSWRGNNFAFTAPMSKGATPWKTRVAYVKALRSYSDPSILDKLIRDNPNWEPALESLVVDIAEAAERNGHDSRKLFKQALGVVRGEQYRRFFTAWSNADEAEMEEASKVIIRLHAGLKQIIKSGRERGVDFTDKDVTEIVEVFERAQKEVLGRQK